MSGQSKAATRPLPAKLSHEVLLEYLLGAPVVHTISWNGVNGIDVDLAVPEGADPVWTRAVMNGVPASLMEVAGVVRENDQNALDAGDGIQVLPLGSGHLRWLHPFGPSSEAFASDERVVYMPTGEPAPRLDGAILSYTELYDLRLAFRVIDRGAPEMPSEGTAKAAQSAVAKLAEAAANPEVSARGELDLRFGADTPAARVVLAQRAVDRAAWQARATVTWRLDNEQFGFGSIAAPTLPAGFAKTEGAGAFVAACAAVGVSSPIVIAAIAGLEQPSNRLRSAPSILEHREAAGEYWKKRKSDKRIRDAARSE